MMSMTDQTANRLTAPRATGCPPTGGPGAHRWHWRTSRPCHPAPRQRGGGFTLTELLVAIAIVSLMITLVSRILVESSNATAVGMALSEVIGTGRTTSAQLRHDARFMVGPGGLTAESNPRQFEYSPDRGGFLVVINHRFNAQFLIGGDTVTREVRSDQVMWVRQGHGETALTPSHSGRYDNDLAAPYLLVWYGHGQPINQIDPEQSDDLGSGRNALAPDFPLARQALQLYERQMSPGRRHVRGGLSGSGVQNGPGQRFNATCDVAFVSLHNRASDAAQDGLLIVGQAPALLQTNSPDGTYRTGALGFAFAAQRLRVLLRPSFSETGFEPDAIARMHPLLARGVSEFEVAMAMDDGNGRPIRDGNNIRWFDMDDQAPGAFSVPGAAGTVAWVFRHDDIEDSSWPHLLRIRYRVHDREARLTGPGDEPGRWFEQVIRVTRP